MALRRCAEKVKKHKPVRARYIATQACRAATNGRTFLNDVSRKVGLKKAAQFAGYQGSAKAPSAVR
mgnify:CR=1 FL=1